jgi:hypothetical protein
MDDGFHDQNETREKWLNVSCAMYNYVMKNNNNKKKTFCACQEIEGSALKRNLCMSQNFEPVDKSEIESHSPLKQPFFPRVAEKLSSLLQHFRISTLAILV